MGRGSVLAEVTWSCWDQEAWGNGWGFVTAVIASRASPVQGGCGVLFPLPLPPCSQGSLSGKHLIICSFPYLGQPPRIHLPPGCWGMSHAPCRVRVLSPHCSWHWFPAHRRAACFLFTCLAFPPFLELESHVFQPIPSPWRSEGFNSQLASCKLGEENRGIKAQVWGLAVQNSARSSPR